MYSSIGGGLPSDAGGSRFDPQRPLFHQIHANYEVYCEMWLTRCSHNVVNYMTLGLGENGLGGAAVKNQGGDRTAPIYIYIYIYTYMFCFVLHIYI